MSRRKRSKKWISWLIILVLLIVAGVVCYLVWDNYFNDQKKDEQGEPETSEQIENEKSDVGNDVIDEESDDKKVKQYEGEDPNKAEELSGVVTYADVTGDKVIIRANIDQYLSEGNCKLNLVSGGVIVYEDTANVISSASTATCEGFDIPLSEVDSGNYKITIKIEANEKTGTIEGTLDI